MGDYFKSSNFKSFCRQLNFYGFQKIRNLRGWHEFKHENFKKGHPELLRQISKKPSRPLCDTSTLSKLKSPEFSLSEECKKLNEEIAEMERCLNEARFQKQQLTEANSKMFEGLLFRKGNSMLKVQKLMYLFFVLINSYSPELMHAVRTSMMMPLFAPRDKNANLLEILIKLNDHAQSICSDLVNLDVTSCASLDQAVNMVLDSFSNATNKNITDVFGPYCKEIAEWIGESSFINVFVDSNSSMEEIYSMITAKIREFVGQIEFKTTLNSFKNAGRLSLSSIDFSNHFN